ncbi:P-loop containing nucleoside triphosphate hydrolase protein [Aspergillus floccosus]
MSREIDRLPQPCGRKKTKLVIASCSRTGTLGLYSALKILGYHPYHMAELVLKGGVTHMKLMMESIVANRDRLSGIKRYNREDVEKWLADYDCLIEIPSYLGTSVFEEYAADPDVQFILTERDPAAWARSVNNTAGRNVTMAATFPFSVLKHFNRSLGAFFYLNELAYWAMSDATNMDDPDNEACLRRTYVEYIQTVKQILPKERTLVVRLEDGLGWEQICPFLGVPIPKEDYPMRNDPKMFEELLKIVLKPWMKAAMIRMGMFALSTLGVVGYLGWRYYQK